MDKPVDANTQESFINWLAKVKAIIDVIEKKQTGTIYHGVTYCTLISLLQKYKRELDELDLFIWEDSNIADRKNKVRITTRLPSFEDEIFVIKLSAPKEEKLIEICLYMIQNEVPIDLRSLILDNTILKPETVATFYWCFYYTIRNEQIMESFITDVNTKYNTTYTPDKIIKCFHTGSFDEHEQCILVPIKFTFPFNMLFSLADYAPSCNMLSFLATAVSITSDTLNITNNNIDGSILNDRPTLNDSNRNKLLNFLCNIFAGERCTNFEKIKTSYVLSYKRIFDFCFAKELIDENDVVRILVCELIVERQLQSSNGYLPSNPIKQYGFKLKQPGAN